VCGVFVGMLARLDGSCVAFEQAYTCELSSQGPHAAR
jgi:hypothetical protein